MPALQKVANAGKTAKNMPKPMHKGGIKKIKKT
jgi:hypothetical protein